MVSFIADANGGIYELDQDVIFPPAPTSLTLTFYAKTNEPSACGITVAFGYGSNYFGYTTVGLTSSYTKYSVQGQTDGTTSGFVALEVQCSYTGVSNEVYIDDVTFV